MILSTEIAPALNLAPFVRCYTFREFDTQGRILIKPWHASHEVTMPFFFNAKPLQLINPQTGQILKGGSFGGVTGLGTQYNGEISFNGCYTLFEICFKPNGFYKIFRLPAKELTNYIFNVEDIFDISIKDFYEQLYSAKGLQEMALQADAFLIHQLKKQESFSSIDGITIISNLILKNAGIMNVEDLAREANMSKRNFERIFTEKVGVSPKLFCGVTRFNYALNLKLNYPKKDWTSIAVQCGYFDQMHLIKDFKKYAGASPSTFLKQTPLTEENFTRRIEL